MISFVELEGLEEGRLNEDGTRSPDGPTVENLEPDATQGDDEINGGQLETVEITYTPKVLIKQYTSNTFTTQIFGSNEPPVYHFIYPENQGTWGQEGSDGLIWIGCMSCHAENGAYRYAAYHSQEHLRGILGAFVIDMAALPLATSELGIEEAEYITVWRNTDNIEISEILETKMFRNGSDFKQKQFWLSEEGLEMWNNSTFSKSYNMKLKVNKSLLRFTRELDGFPALSVPEESMDILNSNFIYESIEITPVIK